MLYYAHVHAYPNYMARRPTPKHNGIHDFQEVFVYMYMYPQGISTRSTKHPHPPPPSPL